MVFISGYPSASGLGVTMVERMSGNHPLAFDATKIARYIPMDTLWQLERNITSPKWG
jgi:hypothetical protein